MVLVAKEKTKVEKGMIVEMGTEILDRMVRGGLNGMMLFG